MIDDEVKERRDVSSSIVSMEPVLQIEQKLVQALDSYANELQRKVNTIRSGLAQMRKPTEIHHMNTEKFLGNPLNSFPMLRRFKNEWRAWEMFLRKPVGKEKIQSIHKMLNDVIDYDIFKSIERIELIRKMYDIQPNDWIEGKLHRKKYELKFSALDAYSVGFLLFKKKNYIAANDWYVAALRAYKNWDMYNFLNFNRSFIYEFYVNNLLKQSNKKRLIATYKKSLDNLLQFPDRTELALKVANVALGNDANVAIVDNVADAKLIQKEAHIKMENLTTLETADFKGEPYLRNSITRGCRGDYVLNASLQLYCYYNWSANDFVRLAPFKVEELFLDPVLLLYHDIVNDDEISELKNISRHQLKGSKTHFRNSMPSYSTYRSSKNAWICDNESEYISCLDQRIKDFTGLQTADEPLLVGNYGLGGFSKEHTDCLTLCNDDDDEEKLSCNTRYMTVLIYLTDMENGGATIFPKLETSVVPQKGNALIWYNLKNDMEQCDKRTVHMECPVIVGSKWCK